MYKKINFVFIRDLLGSEKRDFFPLKKFHEEELLYKFQNILSFLGYLNIFVTFGKRIRTANHPP